MNLLQVALRALIVTTVGTGLVHVIGSAFQFTQVTWVIIGVIWALVFIPWIWSPAFPEN